MQEECLPYIDSCDYSPVLLPARNVDMVFNGDFEHVSPVGSMVDGGFWNGAEGRTATEALGNRYLRLGPAEERSLFQRVAVDGMLTQYLSNLQVRIKLDQLDDEVQITLSEGSRYHTAHRENFIKEGNNDPIELQEQWSISEIRGGSELDLVPQPGGNPIWLSGFGTGTSSTRTTAGDAYIDIGSQLVYEWEAHEDGIVRMIVRPSRGAAGTVSSIPIQLQLDHVAGATTTTVRSWTIGPHDPDGLVLLERVAMCPGDSLRMILSHGDTKSEAFARWDPTIAYEGRGVTYRFTNDPAAIADPPCNGTDHLYVVKTDPGFTAGQWHTFTCDFVADFETLDPTTTDYPEGPLDIRISVDETNEAFACVDDLEITSPFSNRSPVELRAAVIEEFNTLRDYHQWTVDRDGQAPSPGAVGLPGANPPHPESPYSVHRLRISGGVSHFRGGVSHNGGCLGDPKGKFGDTPEYLVTSLAAFYDDQAFADVEWIKEQDLRRESTHGPGDHKYDCEADVFAPAGVANENFYNGVNGALASYRSTGDPSYLDRAYKMTKLALLVGTYRDPNFTNKGLASMLIRFTKYHAENGTNAGTQDLVDRFWLRAHMPDAALRTYVACREFNEANPTLARYPASVLNNWLPKLELAFDTVERFHTPAAASGYTDSTTLSSDVWGGSWHGMGGIFNDKFGYQSQRALETHAALAAHPNWTGPELDSIREDVLSLPTDDILTSGAGDLYPKWLEATSRGERSSGDDARAYPAFSYLADVLTDQRAIDYANQLILAAFDMARFQVDRGIWTAGNNEEFHYKDFSEAHGSPLSPPEKAINAIEAALHQLSYTSSEYWDLVALASSIFENTREHYRLCFGYVEHAYPTKDQKNSSNANGKRFMGAMAGLIQEITDDLVENGVLEPAPTVAISPNALADAPLTGQQPFSFSVGFPEATSDQEALDAFDAQVKILKWSYDPMVMDETDRAYWTSETVWPDQAVLFDPPTVQSVAGVRTVTRVLQQGGAAGDGDFKYSLRAWNAAIDSGLWSQTSSFQEAW